MSPARRRCAHHEMASGARLNRAPERARPGPGRLGGTTRHSPGERGLLPATARPLALPRRLPAPAAGGGSDAGPAAPPAALGHGGHRDRARHGRCRCPSGDPGCPSVGRPAPAASSHPPVPSRPLPAGGCSSAEAALQRGASSAARARRDRGTHMAPGGERTETAALMESRRDPDASAPPWPAAAPAPARKGREEIGRVHV